MIIIELLATVYMSLFTALQDREAVGEERIYLLLRTHLHPP